MSSEKLKNAPLKEVIFELYWECSTNDAGIQLDNGFDLAQGKFAEKLKSRFPKHSKLIPEGAPFRILKAPLHQYWSGELKWPVVQHGEGMIAINEVDEGYEWANSFKPLIIDTIGKLIESYEEQRGFNKVKLQYIDAYDMDDLEPMDFMVQNLQTELLTRYELPGNLKGFNVQQSFELPDSSSMSITITNGINDQNQKKSVVWTTTIEKQQALMSSEEIIQWIDTAHSATSAMFKKMLKKEFYASLDK